MVFLDEKLIFREIVLYFNIFFGILFRFGRKYKIFDFFKEKNFCYEFCLLNELYLYFFFIF